MFQRGPPYSFTFLIIRGVKLVRPMVCRATYKVITKAWWSVTQDDTEYQLFPVFVPHFNK